MYQPRIYRKEMNADRFRFFSSVYLESDLLIGVSHDCFSEELPEMALREQERLYSRLMEHAARHPDFLGSLVPLDAPLAKQDTSIEILQMYDCGKRSNTGPMSAVAGLFAESVGKVLSDQIPKAEILVENGGDIWVRNHRELLSAIHAGKARLSDKMALALPPGEWGICTSSGSMGHSFSKGRADALCVVAKSTPLADAWATSLANRIASADDLDEVLAEASRQEEILACVAIVDDRMGIRADFEVKPLN